MPPQAVPVKPYFLSLNVVHCLYIAIIIIIWNSRGRFKIVEFISINTIVIHGLLCCHCCGCKLGLVLKPFPSTMHASRLANICHKAVCSFPSKNILLYWTGKLDTRRTFSFQCHGQNQSLSIWTGRNNYICLNQFSKLTLITNDSIRKLFVNSHKVKQAVYFFQQCIHLWKVSMCQWIGCEASMKILKLALKFWKFCYNSYLYSLENKNIKFLMS